MPANFKISSINFDSISNGKKYLFKRPTTIPWNEMALNFSPQLGQSIRIRETYKIDVIANGLATVYANSNRFLSSTNIGYWQHLYRDLENEYSVEREGQMNVPFFETLPSVISHTSSYEWEYHIYRAYQDFRGGFFSTIDACNADLEPAAVPNGFITEANVLDYVKLTQKLAGRDFLGVLEDVINLTKTTTNGFRFPDKKNLFTALNQILVVDLETYDIPTAIGDLGICLHPGYNLLGCSHTIECREFGKIEKLSNQIEPAICNYLPGFQYQFPSDQPCQPALENFITNANVVAQQGTNCGDSVINWFINLADAQAAVANYNSTGNGGYSQNFSPPVQHTFICPDGNTTLPYWTTEGLSSNNCI